MKTYEETLKFLIELQEAFKDRCKSTDLITQSENISLLNYMMISLQRMIEHQYTHSSSVVMRNAREVVEALERFTYLKADWQ